MHRNKFALQPHSPALVDKGEKRAAAGARNQDRLPQGNWICGPNSEMRRKHA